MLMGNSINGISISIDAITTSLVEDKSEIELFLSFGASKYEAIGRLFSFAVQKGAMPVLNMMRLVGIVSIPGKYNPSAHCRILIPFPDIFIYHVLQV